MALESQRLDSLPVEIIRRIAGFTTCEALLNLRSVNRTFHDACTDRIVYQWVITHACGNPWPNQWLNKAQGFAFWSRLVRAVADFDRKSVELLEYTREDYFKYAPQLALMRRTSIFSTSSASLDC